ncbi:Neuroblast differentiation-associated protein AHNAK [Portunus trituberculatus]|uniref:Neuroblast differentiation-associated protein AHNAK n=1 Tax=Portunus trituberculatus TaxID=210409 RepID=A0A5B7CN86_PORTR|nr:Neuroblast differentiation-associated protein AHNAK [Portunus trituberculatus]
MKLKAEKPKGKGKLGSCFGKPKSPKVEGQYKPGKLEIEGPKVEVSAEVKAPEAKGDIDTDSPDVKLEAGVSSPDVAVESPNVKIEGGKGKGKLGSCFGKPKTREIEGEYKPGKAELEKPEVSAGVRVEGTEVKGDVIVDAPEIQAKGKKPKAKLGSCFGKPKSPNVEGEYQSGKMDVDVPGVSGEASVKTPEGDAMLNVEAPDAKIKGEKGMKKPKMNFSSCFGKPKGAKLEAGYQPPDVEIKGPEIKSPKVEVEIPRVEADIEVEAPKTSVDVEIPELPEVKGDISMGVDVPKAEPTLKIEGVIPDLPKVEAKLGGKAELPDIEVEGKLPLAPEVKANLDIGEAVPDVKLKGELPKGDLKVDVSGNLPSISGDIKGTDVSLPEVLIPKVEGKVEGNLAGSELPEDNVAVLTLPSVSLKGDFLEREITLGENLSTEYSGGAAAEVEVQIPSVEQQDIDISLPKGMAEVNVNPPNTGVDISGPTVDFEVPEGKAGINIDAPKVKVKGDKPKIKFGSCFGKPERLDSGGEYIPVDVEIPEASAQASIEVPESKAEVSVEAPDMKVKAEKSKPKTDFGSCFGKPKISKVEDEYKPGKVELEGPELEISSEIIAPKAKADIDTEPSEVKVEGKVTPPSVAVESPDINVKGDKRKNKLGSCFGKPKTPRLESEYKPGKAEVKSPEASAGVNAEAPEIEGSISVEAPRIKTKTKKSKGKVGSCFGELEGPKDKYQPGIDSPGVAGEASVQIPTGEAELNGETPDVKVTGKSKKPNMKLGSCFGEPKGTEVETGYQPTKVRIEGPKIEVPKAEVEMPYTTEKMEVKTPDASVDIEVPGLPEVKGDINMGMGIDVPKAEPTLKIEGNISDLPKVEAKLGGKAELSNIGIEGTLPSSPKVKANIDTNGPMDELDVKLEGDAKIDMNGSFPGFSGNIKGSNTSLPEISVPKMEGGITGELPSVKLEGDSPSMVIEVDSPDFSTPSEKLSIKSPKLETKCESESIDINADLDATVPDIKVKSEKHKINIGSWLGKAKSPLSKGHYSPTKAQKVDAEITGTANIRPFDAQVDLDIPVCETKAAVSSPDTRVESPEVNIKGGKGKAKLGSCFGKPKTPDVEGEYKPRKAKIEGPEMSAGMNVATTEVEGDVSVETKSKRPKAKFGSCFGKPKSSEMEGECYSTKIETDVPGIAGEIDVTGPYVEDGDLSLPAVEVKAEPPIPPMRKNKLKHNIDVPEAGVTGKLPDCNAGASLQATIPDVLVGTNGNSFGLKSDIPQMKAEVGGFEGKLNIKTDVPDIKGNVPEVTGETSGSTGELNINAGVPEIKADTQRFGGGLSSKANGLEMMVDIPEVKNDGLGLKGKMDFSADVPEVKACIPGFGGGLNFKADVPEMKTDVTGFGGKIEMDAHVPEVKANIPEIKADVPGFAGKLDFKTDVPEIKADVPGFGGKLDFKADVPEIKTDVPGFGGKLDFKADVPEAKADVPEIKANVPGFGGKLDFMADVPEVKADVPGFGGKLDFMADVPEVKADVSRFGGKLDFKADAPEVKPDVPGFGGKLDFKADVPEVKADVSRFGGKLDFKADAPEVKADVPDIKVGVPLFGGKLDFKTDVPEMKAEVPGLAGKLDFKSDVPEIKADVPEIKANVPRFGGKLDLKVDVPDIKAVVPEMKPEVPGFGGKMDFKADAPEVKADVPGFGGKLEFKDDVPEIKTDVPGFGGKVNLKADVPEVQADVLGFGGKLDFKADVPEVKADVPELKADVPKFGGKLDFKADVPEVKADVSKMKVDVPGFGRKLDFKADVPEVKSDVPGFGGKLNFKADVPDIKADVPEIKTNVPGFGGKLDFKADVPDVKVGVPGFGGKLDFKADVPDIKADVPEIKANVPGFGGKLDFNADVPEVKADVQQIKANVPEVGGKLDFKTDVPEIKANVPEIRTEVPGFGGKLDFKADIPEVKADVPQIKADVPRIGGKLDFKADVPEIKADVQGFGRKLDFKDNVPEVKADVPGLERKLTFETDVPDIKSGFAKIETNIPGIGGKLDVSDVKGDVSGFGGKLDLKAAVPETKGYVPEFAGKGDVKCVVPEFQAEAPRVERQLDYKDGIPDFSRKMDIQSDIRDFEVKQGLKADVPDVRADILVDAGLSFKGAVPNVKANVPAHSEKIDLTADIPELKHDAPRHKGIDLSADVPKVKTDLTSLSLKGDVLIKPVPPSTTTGVPLQVNVASDVYLPEGTLDIHNDAPRESRSSESNSLKTRIPVLDIKSRLSEPTVSLSSTEADLSEVQVGTGVSPPREDTTAPSGRGSRKKRGRRGRGTEEDIDVSSIKPWEKPGDKVEFTEGVDVAMRGLDTQLKLDTEVSGMSVSGGNDDSPTRSRIPRFSGVSKQGTGAEDMTQPRDMTADGVEGQVKVEGRSGIPVLSERISISFRPQDETEVQSNIPVAATPEGAAPIGWVLPPSTTQSPTHGVILRDDRSLPGEGVTIQPGQYGVKGEITQHMPDSNQSLSIDSEENRGGDPYIKGKLGPFKLTPERTVSKCKPEITKVSSDPESLSNKSLEAQGPETMKEWTLEPQSYQVKMETDPSIKLMSDPTVTELHTRMVIGDGDQRASKQSRTVFVTEDAGGRVVVHRRMDSTSAPSGEQTISSAMTTTPEDLSSMLSQGPSSTVSTVVTTSEWPEGVTTQKTVRVRKIRKIKVGDGPEETILETDYETVPGEEPDLSRLEGMLQSSEVLRVTPEGEPSLSHLPPELRDTSLLHFDSNQREAPGDTHQTVTRTVKRIPSGEIAQYLPEGFDKNLHKVVGGTTTTTTKTVRKVKMLKKDESGNMVECDADDEDLQTLLPYLSSESASSTVPTNTTTTTTTSSEDDGGVVTTTTTTTTDGGTVTRVIRQKRFITDGSSISEFEEGPAAAGECEGGVPERVRAEPEQSPDDHRT